MHQPAHARTTRARTLRRTLAGALLAATAAGCATPNGYRAAADPPSAYTAAHDAVSIRDAVAATGDTSIARNRLRGVGDSREHGCVGPVPVAGPGLNRCPDPAAR
jgi:hypothetical protein